MTMDLKNLSSNWKKLQNTSDLQASTSPAQKKNELKRKRNHGANVQPRKPPVNTQHNPHKRRRPMDVKASPSLINAGKSENVEIGKYVALDCEMVGIGPRPRDNSALARVSLVNYNGDQIYDSYVRPKEEVTDWRTAVSGIEPKHMREARTLENVQADVAEILEGRVVVGHALRHDFDVLFLSHPKADIRDTSKHPQYRKWAGGTPKLKLLASELLGLNIQEGEHSSVEDARACMLLFRRDKDAFEREHAKHYPQHRQKEPRQVQRKKKR